jgi:hypothetical protein
MGRRQFHMTEETADQLMISLAMIDKAAEDCTGVGNKPHNVSLTLSTASTNIIRGFVQQVPQMSPAEWVEWCDGELYRLLYGIYQLGKQGYDFMEIPCPNHEDPE